MTNPQPALDLLISLPSQEKSVLRDWWIYASGAEHGDDIKDYPELWGDESGWEMPSSLADLDEEDRVSIGHWSRGSPPLNLNAIAIGLGLEQSTYEPERFNGLLYEPPGHAGEICAFYETVIATGGTGKEARELLDEFIRRLSDLGVGDEPTEIETAKVGEVIS
ncbi:hypothetical protein [Haloarcula sp. Atlit-7R]|uniref:hypothetical protein n=1 Tax=Haloarcula sp. Atlit-7R TaxID=2282125 RepID=UPI0018F47C5D|nr:hypothetical protein [Haloarcula sp. Atlit-7R]